MTKYTGSVVGGGMGGKLSIDALASSDRFELVAAADLREDVRKELEERCPGLRTFPDHASMFAECPTEVVCVSTYPPSHEQVAMDALQLPLKGILVEKPLGHTADSGRRIVNAIRERGLPMAVPHGLLAKKTPLEIIDRVRQGEIGELKLVEIQCRNWDIINAGIHWLNFCVSLCPKDPPAWVMAQCDSSTRTYRDGMQVETMAVTYVQTTAGVRFVMNTGDYANINRDGKEFLFRIVGTAGQVEFWGWENGYLLQNAKHPSGDHIVPEEYAVTGHRRHLEKMADMIKSSTPDWSIPESSLRALELVEGAYLSSRHRCQVVFPLQTFEPPATTGWDPGQPYSGEGGGRNGRNL